MIVLTLIALGFVVLGIFMAFQATDWRGNLVAWTSIIFFGFGLFVFIKQLLNNSPRIILDDEGIEDKSLGIGKILWEDIESAYPNRIKTNKFISLKVRNSEKYLQRNSKFQAKLASYNKSLGFETLNLNLVGLATPQTELLNLLQDRLALNANKAGKY